MNRIYFLLLSIVFLTTACDDGDIIVTSFDFSDASLAFCGETGDYVFYKINNEAQESISVQLNTPDVLFLEDGTRDFVLGSTGNVVDYRIFNGTIDSNYYCNSIPPTNPQATVEYQSVSGTVSLMTTLTLDDTDGVATEDEFDGDTDEDGIPNFYDFDDDGDNVPTATEIGVNPENPLDTDMDGIPNYLDNDDDNDGVLTINEDANMDLNPANDVTDPTVGPDYLNSAVISENSTEMYREHSYTLNSAVNLFLLDFTLRGEGEEITQETLDLGEISNILNGTVTITPEF